MPAFDPPVASHTKLRFERGPGRIDSYASLYRLGDTTTPGPVLVYIGGAIDAERYQQRANTEPVEVRVEVTRALAVVPVPRLDVIVCPCPIDTRLPDEEKPAGLAWFEHHWDQELLPSLGTLPTALGLVGYSAGAGFAAHLAVVLEARALATLGGAGAGKALGAPELSGLTTELALQGWELEVAIYRNQGDAADEPAAVARRMRAPCRPRIPPAGHGGHKFRDYASNGSVAGAFAFVLERVATPRA